MNELDRYLTFKCQKGLAKRGFIDKKEYQNRLEFELETIINMGFSGYFLVVQDIVNWARNNDIYIGYGRGCFTPEMEVLTTTGLKEIQTLKPGDIVITHKGNEKKVLHILPYDISEDILELEFSDNTIIKCTIDHEIYTKNRGWVQARDLSSFDIIEKIE